MYTFNLEDASENHNDECDEEKTRGTAKWAKHYKGTDTAHDGSRVRCSLYNEWHSGAPTDECPAWARIRPAGCPTAD